MTQEEKQLLLKDLCGRLPYEVNVHYQIDEETDTHKLHVSGDTVLKNYFDGTFILDGYKVYTSQIKPYLRPLSSMTEEEGKEFTEMFCDKRFCQMNDWFNEHHFDYRGLLKKGLVLEATDGMYK